MGASQRAKGKRGELQAREPLLLLTGLEWERGARQSRRGGGRGNPDLVPCDGRPCPIHCEVKVGAAPPVLPALAQATEDAAEGAVPVALVRRDRGRWVLAVAVEDFGRLAEACGWVRR